MVKNVVNYVYIEVTGLKYKLAFLIILSTLFVVLSACQKENRESKGLFIESSSVEFGSLQNPNNRELHFRVQINDYGMDHESEYKVRFIINHAYIRDLIGTESIEVPDTYVSQSLPNNGVKGIVTGSAIAIKKDFSMEKLKKYVEKDEAVSVEIYNENKTLAQAEVTQFKENLKPLVTINSNKKIEKIDVKEAEKIALFNRAISNWTMEEGLSYIEYPHYELSLDEESYLLWISEDKGRMMNTKDLYTIYLLSNSSFKEIKGFIE